MKKIKLQTVMALLLLIANFSYAQTTYTVDNNPGAPADFANLQDAIDAAASGDTLLIQGSPIGYGAIVLTKLLIIMGTGYYLNQNPNTQANIRSSMISGISFNVGSLGSYITGLDSYGTGGSVSVNESDITLVMNRFKFIIINDSINNIMILNNFIWGSYSCGTYCSRSINVGNNCSNIIFKGNRLGTISMSSPVVLKNNYYSSHKSHIANSEVKNNIVGYSSSYNTFINNVSENNVFLSPTTGTITTDPNGNINGASWGDIFIDNTDPQYSDDGMYILKVGSPAQGAGGGGVDCGMFGGGYKLSGIPVIPNIYMFTAPETGYTNDGGIQIHVEVQSNN